MSEQRIEEQQFANSLEKRYAYKVECTYCRYYPVKQGRGTPYPPNPIEIFIFSELEYVPETFPGCCKECKQTIFKSVGLIVHVMS